MQQHTNQQASALAAAVQHDGFSFVTADVMQPLLQSIGGLSDWRAFTDSWNRLEPDPYLAAKGRFRRRRHATFAAKANGVVERAPHQPHYQALQYNALQGDIQRWFEPIEPSVADGASLQTILAFCHAFFGLLSPSVAQWHIEVHQF